MNRNLILCKNQKGEIKIAQYGISEGNYQDDCKIIVDFCKNTKKINKLLDFLKNIDFMSAQEISELAANVSKGLKSSEEYYDKFISANINTGILDNIVSTNKKTLKLISYANRMKDTMFIENIFEIDFSKNKLTFHKKCVIIEQIDLNFK